MYSRLSNKPRRCLGIVKAKTSACDRFSMQYRLLSLLRKFPTFGIRSVHEMTRSAKNTTEILANLRAQMRDLSVVPRQLDAYIVPTADAHQSEYIADCDKRRAYVSGFTGSAGTAIITIDKAALWTDGR